jgi:hypothetical protein
MSGSVGAGRRHGMGPSQYLLVLIAVWLLPGCAGFKGYPDRPTLQQDDLRKLMPEISADKIVTCLGMAEGSQELCRNNLVPPTSTLSTFNFQSLRGISLARLRNTTSWTWMPVVISAIW